MKKIIEKHLIPSANFIYGFADLQGLIDKKFGGFPFGISIGKRLDDEIIDGIKNGPTLEYFNYYHSTNDELKMLALNIQNDMHAQGIDSIVIEPTISTGAPGYAKYLKTLTTDISHKMVATRAGLGWIGKTDLFISKAFGPRLRLVSLLIKQDPGVPSVPIDKSRCGKCLVCVDQCPAQAANGKLWNIHIHRDEFFDAHKCRKKCGELAKQKLNVDERICGLCIYVCPLGKKKNN